MTVKRTTTTIALLGVLVASTSATRAEVDLSKLPPPAARKGVTYEKDIHPLFEASCIRCHSGDKPKAGLRLDTLESVLKGSKEGKEEMDARGKNKNDQSAVGNGARTEGSSGGHGYEDDDSSQYS